MAARTTTSAYAPAPPVVRLAGRQNGRYSGEIVIKTIDSTDGVKPNMCCAPATNGDRVNGLAASQPASAKSMKGVRARLSTT